MYKENPEMECNPVETMFNRWRKGRVLFSYPQREIYEAVARESVDRIVCDVGSGPGLGTAILAREAQSVTGIEIVSRGYVFAKKCFPLKNVRFLCGDIKDSPLPNADFDVVVAIEIIEHVKDYSKVLSQLCRILKDSGTLYISTPNRNSRGGALSEGPPRNIRHVREWTAGEFRDILLSYFSNVKLSNYTLGPSLNADTRVSPIVAICRDPK